jgi:hypothetical protein
MQETLSFLLMLDLLYLINLTNELMLHDPNWPPVPIKVLSDISIFGGKSCRGSRQSHVEFSSMVLIELPDGRFH